MSTHVRSSMFFCFCRYLSQNFDWLQEQLDDIEDDYILFDCPGMYTYIYRPLDKGLDEQNFSA